MPDRLFYPYHGLDFITRRYYTLGEYFTAITNGEFAGSGRYGPADSDWDFACQTFLPVGSRLEDPHIKELLNNYVYPRFWDEYIIYSDEYDFSEDDLEDPGNWDKKWFFEDFTHKIINWVRGTADKYIKEIEIYEGIEGDLMKTLDATNIVKINDTPQISSDELGTDPYVSNITTSTTKQEIATPIERLKQVRDNIRNTYKVWADEFRQFVMYA